MNLTSIQDERKKLERAGTTHWFHWLIVGLSLSLTVFAWWYSNRQLQEKVEAQFDREAEQVIDLVRERMQRYEDALWAGTATINAAGNEVDFPTWQNYAERLSLLEKYPGINGLGVIHAVDRNNLDDYLKAQRAIRPGYHVHPAHDGDELFPITYVVPAADNSAAVGLDMAHESNRLSATLSARDSGKARITGPITLVQDAGKTPGFLFFAPVYSSRDINTAEKRRQTFHSLVYAPFVVKKLAQGVLDKEKRHVGLRITDGDSVLYDEHTASETDFDPNPLFKRQVSVNMYGRSWTFDIWSAKSFREKASSSEPLQILFGGLMIDGLLVLLFVSISRASRQALASANAMTRELEKQTEELEQQTKELARSNAELEQFAYIASHDLQQPLRAVASCCQILESDFGDQIDEDGKVWLQRAADGAERMKQLVKDLLAFSRIGADAYKPAIVQTQQSAQQALQQISMDIEERQAKISVGALPPVLGDEGQLVQVFQNLIGNAIKYCERQPEIDISACIRNGECEFQIRDNGIGMNPTYRDRIFVIFQRLHGKDEYSGTGIGLAICKKIVERLQGRIWVNSAVGQGSTFFFTLPAAPNTSSTVVSPNESSEETVSAAP